MPSERGSPLAWGRGCTAGGAREGAAFQRSDGTAGVAAPGWAMPAMPRHWGSPGLRPGRRKDGGQLWDGGRADLSRAQGVSAGLGSCSRRAPPGTSSPLAAGAPRAWQGGDSGWEHRLDEAYKGYKNHIFIPSEGSGQIKVIVWEALAYFSWLGAGGRREILS